MIRSSKTSPRRSLRCLFTGMAALTALTGSSALAAVATYNGTSANFSTGFTGGSAAGEPASGDSLLFNAAGTAGTTLTDDLFTPANYSLAGITFSATASAYTINPATAGTNGFTLASGGITNNSTNLQTINDLITLSGVQTFTTTAGGGNLTLGGIVSGTGSGITTAGSGTLTLSAANTFTGVTTIASGTTLVASNAGSLGTSANTAGVAVNGTLNLSGPSGTNYTFGGAVTGAGTINATVSGNGSINNVTNLSGFTGTLNLLGTSGRLQVQPSSTTPIIGASAINVAAGTQLYFNSNVTTAAAISLGGGSQDTLGQIRVSSGNNSTFSGPITLAGTVTSGQSTLAAFNGGSITVSGAIGQTGGAQGFTVEGQSNTSVITLTAANTYTGATNVGAAYSINLRVNGSIGSAGAAGLVTVKSGSILSGAGNGTTTGLLTVSSATISTGATLTPGATTAATTGTLTLNTTGGIALNGTLLTGITATGSTILSTNGALTLGPASILTVAGTSGAAAYDIANYGSETGTFATTTSVPPGYTINYSGSTFSAQDIELDMTAVPEPSTWALVMVLGAVGVALRRRKARVS